MTTHTKTPFHPAELILCAIVIIATLISLDVIKLPLAAALVPAYLYLIACGCASLATIALRRLEK